jgi:hypothetical protein
VSAVRGGKVNFRINPGPLHAGAEYFVIGSLSGTDPGTYVGNGVVLPLNLDAFSQIALDGDRAAMFRDFHGTLDATGNATARFDLERPFARSMVGSRLSFAVLVRSSGAAAWAWASNPYTVTIVP